MAKKSTGLRNQRFYLAELKGHKILFETLEKALAATKDKDAIEVVYVMSVGSVKNGREDLVDV